METFENIFNVKLKISNMNVKYLDLFIKKIFIENIKKVYNFF